jgi:hypothetical protein
MPDGFVKQLMKVNPEVMESLEYEHIPLAEQLDLGIRKLELDVFYVSKEEQFLVGHVQQIDMNSNCSISTYLSHSNHCPGRRITQLMHLYGLASMPKTAIFLVYLHQRFSVQ